MPTIATTMSLCIVFYQFKTIALANIANTLRIGTNAIEVDNQQSPCTRGDGTLYLCIVNLKGIK